jgi:integrase
LTEAEHDGSADRFAIAAFRLLILTGARLSEIRLLKWSEVDFERACLRLSDSKTGQKVIYLSAPALELLAELPRMAGNPHVIPGRRPGAPVVNLEKPWRRIRDRAGLDDVRLHDLRHSFASIAAGGGLSLPFIGALLGHSQPQTTARYSHLAADPVRAANEAVGRRIAAAMSGPADHQGEIVPVRRRG